MFMIICFYKDCQVKMTTHTKGPFDKGVPMQDAFYPFATALPSSHTTTANLSKGKRWWDNNNGKNLEVQSQIYKTLVVSCSVYILLPSI